MNIREITQRIADGLDQAEPRCGRVAEVLAAALRLHGHPAKITGGAMALATSERPQDTLTYGYDNANGVICIRRIEDVHVWCEVYGLVCDATWGQARRRVLSHDDFHWTIGAANYYVGPPRNGHRHILLLRAGEALYTPVSDAPAVRRLVEVAELDQRRQTANRTAAARGRTHHTHRRCA